MRDDDRTSDDRLTSRRDVIRTGLGAALLAAMPMPLRESHTWHAAAPDDRYLDVARRAGTWLKAAAITTPNGKTWPAVPPDPKSVDRSLYTGSPGVVLFLLELHGATGDSQALELARSGAEDLAASLPDELGADDSAGLYSGVAGIGYVLAEAATATRDQRLAAAARKALGLVTASAREAGAGVEWNDSTDIISGSSGIGLYLLSPSVQGAARDVAVKAGRRLLEREYRTGDHSLWMMSPSFTRNMPNFSHGTAGVSYFLATLGGETKDKAFIDAAVRGARYLQSIAQKTDGDGRRIFHNDPDGRSMYYLSWCHGPAGTARLFHRLGTVTGDAKWTAEIPRLAQGIIASGVPERSPGFWNNVSQCCGNCGVSDFFASQYSLTGTASYLAFAQRCADDTVARGTAEGQGMKWIQAENRVSPDQLFAQTGLMQGAAGVGLAMLRLDAHMKKRRPLIVLPDAPYA